MSIRELREQLSDIPGASTMTMEYENGGRIQVFKIGEVEVRLESGLTNLAPAIRAAIESNPSSING